MHRCHYCGCELARGDLTRDHIVPRSKRIVVLGPTRERAPETLPNTVLCCPPCNQAKGDRRVVEHCGLCDAVWATYGKDVSAEPMTVSMLAEKAARIRRARLQVDLAVQSS